jgi:hypothetical protein
MAYSDIAEAMGCSEFSTRMLFLRAKRSLQRELMRNGFKKGSLLAALALFGKITAPSKAAAAQVTVSTTALKVGTVATIAGVATTKTAIISLAAAGAITAGVGTTPSGREHQRVFLVLLPAGSVGASDGSGQLAAGRRQFAQTSAAERPGQLSLQ